MDAILTELGLHDFLDRFIAERIVTPEDVLLLRDDDFQNLGVVRIGDRNRLRDRCRPRPSTSRSDKFLTLLNIAGVVVPLAIELYLGYKRLRAPVRTESNRVIMGQIVRVAVPVVGATIQMGRLFRQQQNQ